MTDVSTTPQRYQKKVPAIGDEKGIAELRTEAKALGINSHGLGKAALAATIDAVRGARSVPVASTDASPEINEVRSDDAGEALGPQSIERVPLGVRRRRLSAPQRPGFYRRWINDVYGRVERARAAGYEHVRDSQGNPVSAPAGAQEAGGGLRAYLMELPDKMRQTDLAEKRRVNDEIDDALNRGTLGQQADDKRYVPNRGISIRR